MDFCSYLSNMSLWESVKKQSDIPLMLAKHVFSSEFKGIDSNMVFSPLSIQIVLGFIATGSKGQTMDQLLSFFKLNSIEEVNSLSSWLVANVLVDGSPRGGPRLSFANGAWVDRTLSFKHSFKHIMDNVYKAASAYVDFRNKPDEVAKEVNKWAEEKTNGLIKEILPPGAVNNMTRLILANALYFKGEWVKKFNASETKDYDFYLLNGTSIKAPFMTKNGFSTVAAAYAGFKVLGLPYKYGNDNRRFCMYFILPDANDGLSTIWEKMTSEPDFLNRHLPSKTADVRRLLIPKFKITFNFEASKVLKEVGLTHPFCGDGLAEIVDDIFPLFVSKVFHKSFIEVNEEGTEAAAVTAATMMFGCSGMMIKEEQINFVADHPFLFLVKDDVTGVILFIGTVLNPLAV